MEKNEALGLKLGDNDKIEEGTIIYGHEVPDSMRYQNDLGAPIIEGVAQKLIKRHWLNIKNEMSDNEVIAVYFTKENLEILLNQTGCIGVRFYFAYKNQDDFKGSIKEGKTLVAVGINGKKYDIATKEKNYIVKSIKTDVGIIPTKDPEDGIIIEMVPPLTLGKVRDDPKGFLDDSLESIIKKFFNL